MIIQEQDLDRLLRCPLMVQASPSNEEICAYALASWVLQQSFKDKLKGDSVKILHTIRGKLLDLWGPNKHEAGTLARTSAFRLFGLILDYEILHLEQPYNLILGKYTIQGKYALLKKRKGEHLPYILMLHTYEPELKHSQALPPDAITMSRYIHAYTNDGHSNAQVLHYPVFRGKPWLNKHINMPLAKEYLGCMLKTIDSHPRYPIMGEHCHKCVTKSCLEVYKIG